MRVPSVIAVVTVLALFSCAQSRSAASVDSKIPVADTMTKPYWEISLNKQTVLRAGKESRENNRVSFAKDQLSQEVTISFYDDDPSLYKRSILILNTTGNTIYRKENVTTTTITAKEFAALWAGADSLEVQSFAIPSDPELAARVRIRPQHLCTFVLR